MRRRYVISTGAEEFDSPLPGRGLLQEAVAAAVIVFCAACLLELGVVLFFKQWDFITYAPQAIGLNIIASASLALSLTIYRTLRFERRERAWLQELEKQRRLEEYFFSAQEKEEGEELSRARLDFVALTMLRNFYQTLAETGSLEEAAHAMSREHLEKHGIKQEEWNIVNGLLQAWGIRDGRKRHLIPDTFEEAWRIWVEHSANPQSYRVVKGRLIPQR